METPNIAPFPAQHDLGGNPRFGCTPVEIEDNAPPDDFGKRMDVEGWAEDQLTALVTRDHLVRASLWVAGAKTSRAA
ncbi:hypothetical protein [Roseococcus sp.]|uniref:hypothetical protein n=1 Tax=Roseococcus sp. TaxID=2109646 RepID=UPI003BABE681